MLKSYIQSVNGKPMINIDGTVHFPIAYTTYFDECGKWSDFIKRGYKMFFVNVSFTDLPINNITGFSPFRIGVFENETADYSEFEGTVCRILTECPDALIFPRINIAMPRKWIEDNPFETVDTKNGGKRESLFSDRFRQDGKKLLSSLISHIRNSDYANRIAGYQLCGGTTQEWMHHDMSGSFSDLGVKEFQKWLKIKYGTEKIKAPDRSELENGVFTEGVCKYYEFCNEVNVNTIEYFAKSLKELINNEQIVGVFYGYNAFVNDPLLGLHGLRHIIYSPYIDFFSSPCAYDCNRSLGIDWGDMLPVDSVKLHGKLCFIECDIRTHLTKRMQDSRPGEYPDDIYPQIDENGNKTAWCGPGIPELSLSAIRKAFAHQITKSSGIWWFDMWGGWYDDKCILNELENLRKAAEKSLNHANHPAEVALFIDERAYFNIPSGSPFRHSVNEIRVAMGNTGIPFDIFMTEDAEKTLHRYKAAVFTSPLPSDSGKTAIDLCRNLGIPCLISTKAKQGFTVAELRCFLVDSGIHCYNHDGCVVYNSNGILGIHTVCEGKVKISLPEKSKLQSLYDDKIYDSDSIVFPAEKHHTYLFEYIS